MIRLFILIRFGTVGCICHRYGLMTIKQAFMMLKPFKKDSTNQRATELTFSNVFISILRTV